MKFSLWSSFKKFLPVAFLYLIWSGSSITANTGTERFVYDIQVHGKNYKEYVTVHRTKDLLQYESCGNYTNPKIYAPGGKHCWDVLSTSDGQPRLIEYKVGRNYVRMTFSKEGHFELKGFWDGKKCFKQKSFENKVYVELSSLMRTIDLNQKEPLLFELIKLTRFPKIETHHLFIKVMEDVEVKVPAGLFSCKKIMLSVSGYKGYFFKAYFFVSNDDRQIVVKIENLPIGGVTTLISFRPV